MCGKDEVILNSAELWRLKFIAVFLLLLWKSPGVIRALASCSPGCPPATPWLFVAHGSWLALCFFRNATEYEIQLERLGK